jgi:hypothetical protein
MVPDSPDKADFSLTQGGPVDRALERIGFLPDLSRKIALVLCVSWLPLLILSAIQGVAIGTTVKIPFLLDIAEQTRLLLVIPLLLIAEPVIDSSIREAVEQFLRQGLVLEKDLSAFKAAVHQGRRWKESVWAEAILAGIIVFSLIAYLDVVKSTHLSTWILSPSSSGTVRSLAGWWFTLISMPLYRFLLFRWLWRFIIWARFLWQVSKLPLHLMPTHADKAGGLAFLSDAQLRFSILLFALSATIAASITNLIIYDGKTLLDFKFTVLCYITLVIVLVLLPLFTFAGQLIELKEKGQLAYSILSMNYTTSFEQKWIQTNSSKQELLGNQDVRSLADMARSFEIIKTMSVVPFDFDTVKLLILATILPFVPLVLTVVPLQDVFEKMREFLL